MIVPIRQICLLTRANKKTRRLNVGVRYVKKPNRCYGVRNVRFVTANHKRIPYFSIIKSMSLSPLPDRFISTDPFFIVFASFIA